MNPSIHSRRRVEVRFSVVYIKTEIFILIVWIINVSIEHSEQLFELPGLVLVITGLRALSLRKEISNLLAPLNLSLFHSRSILKRPTSYGYVLLYPGMYSLLRAFFFLSRHVTRSLRGFPLSSSMLGQKSIVSSS